MSDEEDVERGHPARMPEEKTSRGRVPEDLRSWVAGASLASAGITMALAVAIGAGLGLALDRWLKTTWMVIVGLLIGVAAGFRELFRAVALASREEERAEAERRNRGPGVGGQGPGTGDPE